MANTEHLSILRQGSELWNQWRRENSAVRPDFVSANLSGVRLRAANLHKADLREANLSYADLSRADLREANLSRTNFSRANLMMADLRDANVRGANFLNANLNGANVEGVFVPALASTRYLERLILHNRLNLEYQSITELINSPLRIAVPKYTILGDIDFSADIFVKRRASISRAISDRSLVRKTNNITFIESKLSQYIILSLSSFMIIYPLFFFFNELIHNIIYVSIPLFLMFISGLASLGLGYKWRNIPYDK